MGGRKLICLAGSFLLPALINPSKEMKTVQTQEEGCLPFLLPYKTNNELFSLSSGEKISIQKYSLIFSEWKGETVPNTYGNKAILDYEGEPLFAELAVLKLFHKNGWQGVWVDSYRRKFRVGLPDVVDPVDLPEDKKNIIEKLRASTGKIGGCWDLFLWKNDQILFVELKRLKKDAIQDSQILWLEKSLEFGLTPNNFALIEWDISTDLNFEYPEDKQFFIDLLSDGNEQKFNADFKDYFDFRHHAIKRWEFNKIRKKVLGELTEKYGENCQLKIHPECSIVRKFEPDHIIPLATNELNKRLRNMERTSSEKVLAQSFGSNHPKNLILACSRCNAYKKHRFLEREILKKILPK